MIPLIEKIGEYISVTLPLDIDGNRAISYWATSVEEIPAVVERHTSRVEELSKYLS